MTHTGVYTAIARERFQPVDRRIHWLYPLKRCNPRTTPRMGVLDMTLNCIWWWGSTSGTQRRLKYLFIAITPSSTLIRIRSICWGTIYKSNKSVYKTHKYTMNTILSIDRFINQKYSWRSKILGFKFWFSKQGSYFFFLFRGLALYNIFTHILILWSFTWEGNYEYGKCAKYADLINCYIFKLIMFGIIAGYSYDKIDHFFRNRTSSYSYKRSTPAKMPFYAVESPFEAMPPSSESFRAIKKNWKVSY